MHQEWAEYPLACHRELGQENDRRRQSEYMRGGSARPADRHLGQSLVDARVRGANAS